MNEYEFYNYVLDECKRQWQDNQKDTFGSWSEQDNDTKANYFNQMYKDLEDERND